MFTPWIRRKSLKKAPKSKLLVMGGERPSLIVLLTPSVILIAVGVFAVQYSIASQEYPANATVSATPEPDAN